MISPPDRYVYVDEYYDFSRTDNLIKEEFLEKIADLAALLQSCKDKGSSLTEEEWAGKPVVLELMVCFPSGPNTHYEEQYKEYEIKRKEISRRDLNYYKDQILRCSEDLTEEDLASIGLKRIGNE